MAEQPEDPVDEIRTLIHRAIDCADGNAPEARSDLLEARRRLDEYATSHSPVTTEPRDDEERLAYLADLINHIHDAIVATNAAMIITAWNRAAEALYGWKAEEALGRHIYAVIRTTEAAEIGAWDWNPASGEFNLDARARQIVGMSPEEPQTPERLLQAVHPDDRKSARDALQRIRLEGKASELDLRVLWPDGSEHRCTIEGQAKIDAVDRQVRMMGVVMDTSLRREAELEARRTNAQWEVQHRLMNTRERERMAIARDLHDGPVQDLIAISFGLQGAIQASEDPAVVETLQGLRKALHEQITALRNYAGELRPPALGKFGLEKAIRSHVDQFREKHPEINIILRMHQVGPLTSEPVRLALFRIYQEAMNNVVRHSGATEVVIRFEKDEHQAEFEIRDNGKGFSMPKDWLDLAREGHLGLIGIQERAEAIGGAVHFSSAPGKGTSVLVHIDQLQFEPPTGPRWW